MMLSKIEREIGDQWSVLMDRVRAALWRLRGAKLGAKTRVGSGCKVRRPWRLTTGSRVQFEHAVFVKIADEGAEVRFGSEVFLGFGAELDISHRLWIGNHVLIAPGCFITDHSHRHAVDGTIADQGCEMSSVHIGNDVWLGAHAVILAGVTIGDGAIVGANAVVTTDVEPMAIVAGVPARAIGRRS